MKHTLVRTAVYLAGTLAAIAQPDTALDQWPQWRGPLGNGTAPHGNPPVTWSEGTNGAPSVNIRWQAVVPGRGASSPVVWSNTVVITTAIDTGKPAPTQALDSASVTNLQTWQRNMSRRPLTFHRFAVLTYDRRDGRLLLQRDITEEVPHESTHTDGTWASASAIVDGERIYAFFGSRGLYCMDTTGRMIWTRQFPWMKVRNQFGEGASPCLYGDVLIVNYDHQETSFITALDCKTGTELWKKPRNEITSWSTPLAVEHKGKPQVVVSATQRIRSYDLKTGALEWECGGMVTNVIASPVHDNGIVYALSGYRTNSALLAIQLDRATGDITDRPEVFAWKHDQDAPYTPSPLLADGYLYFLKLNDAFLSCWDTKARQPRYTARKLDGINGVYASPVAAAGRVYVTGRNGVTLVLQNGPEYKVLSRNTLADGFTASPAIVGSDMIMRGASNLYCLAAP